MQHHSHWIDSDERVCTLDWWKLTNGHTYTEYTIREFKGFEEITKRDRTQGVRSVVAFWSLKEK